MCACIDIHLYVAYMRSLFGERASERHRERERDTEQQPKSGERAAEKKTGNHLRNFPTLWDYITLQPVS